MDTETKDVLISTLSAIGILPFLYLCGNTDVICMLHNCDILTIMTIVGILMIITSFGLLTIGFISKVYSILIGVLFICIGCGFHVMGIGWTLFILSMALLYFGSLTEIPFNIKVLIAIIGITGFAIRHHTLPIKEKDRPSYEERYQDCPQATWVIELETSYAGENMGNRQGTFTGTLDNCKMAAQRWIYKLRSEKDSDHQFSLKSIYFGSVPKNVALEKYDADLARTPFAFFPKKDTEKDTEK